MLVRRLNSMCTLQDCSGPLVAPRELLCFSKEFSLLPWSFTALLLDHSTFLSVPWNKIAESVERLGRLELCNSRSEQAVVRRGCAEQLSLGDTFPNLRTLVISGPVMFLACISDFPNSLERIDLSGLEGLKSFDEVPPLPQSHGLRGADCSYCPELRDVAGLPAGLRHLKVGGSNVPSLPRGINAYRFLTRLDVSFTKQMVQVPSLPAGLRCFVADNCENLTDISSVGGCSKLQEFSARRCSQLENLAPLGQLEELWKVDVGGTKVRDLGPVIKPEVLRCLDCSRCGNIRDFSQLQGCSVLETLVLFWCAAAANLSGLDFPQLKHLECNSCERLLSLPPLPKVKQFQVRGCSRLRELPEAPALEQLAVFRLAGLVDISALRYSSVLKALELKWCGSLSCISALQSCEQLEFVSLIGCPVADVSPLASCPRLSVIVVICCQVKSASVLRECALLRALSLHGNEHLEDADLSGCRNLRMLDLRHCAVLFRLSLPSPQILHTLDVGFCSRLDVVSILQQLPVLRHLYLSDDFRRQALPTQAELWFDPCLDQPTFPNRGNYHCFK